MNQTAGEKIAGMGPVARSISSLLVPFILLFGIHMAASSHHEPGGAVEAGIIIAAGYVLAMLAFGSRVLARPRGLMLLTCLGALIFIGAGMAGMMTGNAFLTSFSVMNVKLALLIEIGITLASASALLLLVVVMSKVRVQPGGKDDEFESAIEE